MPITKFNPGTVTANVAVLMLMHIVAWVIAVCHWLRKRPDAPVYFYEDSHDQ